MCGRLRTKARGKESAQCNRLLQSVFKLLPILLGRESKDDHVAGKAAIIIVANYPDESRISGFAVLFRFAAKQYEPDL